jgi:hypothetical protein
MVHLSPNVVISMGKWQRGDTEVQNGYGFCMLLGYGTPNLQVSILALICRPDFKDFSAAELETGS